MLQYIAPFVAYLLVPMASSLLGIDPLIGQGAKFLVVGGLLLYFRENYSMKLKLDPASILSGLAIFALWVGLEGRYPFIEFLGKPEMIPTDMPYLLLRLLTSILIAPIVEEFFTRFFLNRYLQGTDWEKIPLYKFTMMSFIFTVLFFGFMHVRWLPGLITALILNGLLIYTKRIEACIESHFVANLALGLYVILSQNWILWG